MDLAEIGKADDGAALRRLEFGEQLLDGISKRREAATQGRE